MRFRVPANVDMPDRILAGLTLRQLAIIGLACLGAWGALATLPFMLAVFVAALILAAGLGVATSAHHGMSFDRLAISALRYLRSSKKQILAPEGFGPMATQGVTAIHSPILGVSDEGLIDLGDAGFTIVCRASGLNLSLRADDEQLQLLDGFGRMLNSLDGPVQFLVRSDVSDLGPRLARLELSAAALADPHLRDEALRHAAFLAGLAGGRSLTRRQVLVCLREPTGPYDQAEVNLSRRFADCQVLLRGIGIYLTRLTPEDTRTCLRQCCDPGAEAAPTGSDISTQAITGGVG